MILLVQWLYLEAPAGGPQLVIWNKEWQNELMWEAHDNSGHRGQDLTYKKLLDAYFWLNMMADVVVYCQTVGSVNYDQHIAQKSS
jgi:Integrase zinc binding domain